MHNFESATCQVYCLMYFLWFHGTEKMRYEIAIAGKQDTNTYNRLKQSKDVTQEYFRLSLKNQWEFGDSRNVGTRKNR
jgi:hypothetical protein